MTIPATLLQYDRLDYGVAWSLQHRLVAERAAGQRPDTLLLLEHDPVYTIGRSGRDDHWGGGEDILRQSGYPVYHVERGGSITFHGPGQVVGYPIFLLAGFCSGPKAYVRLLEEALIRTLAAWGLQGSRLEKWPGVWIKIGEGATRKIASLGVRIAGGVTMHGFALNVAVDLAPFRRILPCGIPGDQVTSMEAVLGHPLEGALVREQVVRQMGEVFGLEWVDCAGGIGASRRQGAGPAPAARNLPERSTRGSAGPSGWRGTLSVLEGP